ncbi:hypothetical protein IVB34_34470 [Bradyrhizobium sp. 2]|uniref:hypothetical protein n=1 Tax=unclassified Bradyrhizobium TaxID=2631580 RepID=UPI001FF85E9D|nr:MULTISPECIES: hypothetical protein [unclassified Bradyrhizobium]MCK1447758.1 hypothetical protein [Bradyrhizobium sp. 48]MCK1463327.1 hypothetical protein [Bradyrhizobium sp. 2]
MRDHPDTPLNAEALTIMRYATIAQIKDECDELAALFASLSEGERQRLLILLFGADP